MDSRADSRGKPPVDQDFSSGRKRSRRPWFSFYPGDWLSASRVAAMSLAERGAFITLLSHQWIEGQLPESQADIERLLSAPQQDFDLKRVLAAFPDGKNKRLSRERAVADNHSETQRRNVNRRYRGSTAVHRGSTEDLPSISTTTSTPLRGITPPPPSRGVRRSAPPTWQEVLARTEYEPLRVEPIFGTAWERWIAHCSEAGSKAQLPRGSRAAEILNDALTWGPAKFARAVHEAIAHNWQGLFEPKSGPQVNGNGHVRPDGLAPNPFLDKLRETFA